MTHPLLLELNTRCWLRELSTTCRHPMTLSNVPDAVVRNWVQLGITHVWLMGVWTTGPRCRERALTNGYLREAYDRALPDWSEEDVTGSPYAIESYNVPSALGGMAGLRQFRQHLRKHGLQLILDFVPNHVGLDHPWLAVHPEYFVQSSPEHAESFPNEAEGAVRWLAHGRDPHFAAWIDTAQLDYRYQVVHEVMRSELLRLAELCDGVRCDMAMLLCNDVFARTWAQFPARNSSLRPAVQEFWTASIARVKAAYPNFMFLAEVYWDLEERLQAMGFDYTYDKPLADALLRRQGAEFTSRLQKQDARFIEHSAHFLENHDERRVAACLPPDSHRAAAVATLALPGMRFLHDGQLQGATVQTPVQLRRRRTEPPSQDIVEMYGAILRALAVAGVGRGQGRVLSALPGWAGNPTSRDLLVVSWASATPSPALVAVNLASHRSQCRVPLPLKGSTSKWVLEDVLGHEQWERLSSELRDPGLFLDLPPYGTQVFVFQPA